MQPLQPDWFWTVTEPQEAPGAEDLHIWCVTMTKLGAHMVDLEGILSADELREAGKFQRAEHRGHFVFRHAVLRIILAGYLRTNPHELSFVRDTHGKSRLQETTSDRSLRFNASSSQDLALYAFTRAGEVGIDVEYCRPFPEMEQVIRQAFSPAEQELMRSVPADQQTLMFHRYWTRKEAMSKASGMGFSTPLESLASPSDREESSWQTIEVAGLDGYAASVVTQAGPIRLTYFQWPLPSPTDRDA